MKKSFTLLEVIISIILFGLIMFFLYGVLGQLMQSNIFYAQKEQKAIQEERLFSLLYNDLLGAKALTIKDSPSTDYAIIETQTTNSLLGLPLPYVKWLVLKKENTLVRYETPFRYDLPPSEEYLGKIYPHEVAKGCKLFKVYQNGNKIFFYVEIEGKKPTYFEIHKEFP